MANFLRQKFASVTKLLSKGKATHNHYFYHVYDFGYIDPVIINNTQCSKCIYHFADNNTTDDVGDIQLLSTIRADLQFIYGLQTLEGNKLVTVGLDLHKGQYVLRKYLYNGDVVEDAILEGCPAGLAKVNVSNTPCLAVSYQRIGKIDFHKICELNNVFTTLTCPATGVLCTISPSVLGCMACEDSKYIYFLDCDGASPTQHKGFRSIQLKQSTVWSMTLCESTSMKILLVCGPESGHGKIRAYNFQAQELWELSGQLDLRKKYPAINPQDVAYNSKTNSIFVACLEGYVYEISPDGKYLKTVLSPKQGLGPTCHLLLNKTHLVLNHKSASDSTRTTTIDIFGCQCSCEYLILPCT